MGRRVVQFTLIYTIARFIFEFRARVHVRHEYTFFLNRLLQYYVAQFVKKRKLQIAQNTMARRIRKYVVCTNNIRNVPSVTTQRPAS